MTRIPAKDCQSIADVRDQIDQIDRELIDLLALRWTYVDEIWRKKSNNQQVRDPKRVEEMIEKARIRAREAGLPDWIAEGLWKEIIRLGIAFEEKNMAGLPKR